MVNRIGTVYSRELNKGFSLRFCVDTRLGHETPDEDRRTYRPKRSDYNNEDEINSPNILSDKNPLLSGMYPEGSLQSNHAENTSFSRIAEVKQRRIYSILRGMITAGIINNPKSVCLTKAE